MGTVGVIAQVIIHVRQIDFRGRMHMHEADRIHSDVYVEKRDRKNLRGPCDISSLKRLHLSRDPPAIARLAWSSSVLVPSFSSLSSVSASCSHFSFYWLICLAMYLQPWKLRS